MLTAPQPPWMCPALATQVTDHQLNMTVHVLNSLDEPLVIIRWDNIQVNKDSCRYASHHEILLDPISATTMRSCSFSYHPTQAALFVLMASHARCRLCFVIILMYHGSDGPQEHHWSLSLLSSFCFQRGSRLTGFAWCLMQGRARCRGRRIGPLFKVCYHPKCSLVQGRQCQEGPQSLFGSRRVESSRARRVESTCRYVAA